ncbi:MAG: molecular chaperone HtpG [Verrucomicrobia bacterium CG1_02_43_26]|nr:MAG: molecular chaperone HtpG [Verrucomicrobia bacterium CG1_02_43_26]
MAATVEKHEFQAEVKQVLDIVVHSLYTDKEIFVRELISNASDALEKLRHAQLQQQEIFEDHLDLEINVSTDETGGTITIQDFGIGMTRDELIENLGTIAHSGSRKFLEAIKQAGENNQSLIGQFGVGFYSAFMVAESVDVYTHSANKDASGCHWSCDGSNSYTIEDAEGQRRGCKIVIKLKDEYKDFANESRVKSIIERYSSFVQFPITLNGTKVNTIQALWLRGKNEIKEEEYKEFYKFQAHAFDEPLSWLHFSADAPLDIKAILFVPTENMEKFGFGLTQPSVALYCRKVLIDAEPKGLLPEWMRFVKGVVDSADLPLNISRESMQDTALVQKLNQVLAKRFIKHLEELAKKKPEGYTTFWNTFNNFIKEGITTDPMNKEHLVPLLRYESSQLDKEQLTSLPEYLSRAKPDQKEIYYMVGKNREAIEAGPYMEAFKSRGLEVLYLFETVDDFVMSHIQAFEGKKLVSIDQDDIELDDAPEQAEGQPMDEKAFTDLCDWMKQTLGDKRVAGVKAGTRLVGSPVIALSSDKMMTANMRRIMKAMKQPIDASPSVNLQLNTRHPLIKNVAALRTTNEALAKEIAFQLYDNAMVAAGLLEDPKEMIQRTYSLLEKLSAQQ